MDGDSVLLVLQVVTVVLGIAVTTCGGLLALLGDPERPVQCVPVFALSGSVFLGGLALLCWFREVAELVVERGGLA